jgi:hypothetical protein
MKKTLFLLALSFAFFTCTKEPVNVTSSDQPGTEAASDRGPDACSSQCYIRVDSINWPPTFNSSDTYRVFDNLNSPIWYGNIGSALCAPQNIMMGQWYPLNIVEFQQYRLEYSYKFPCNVLHAGSSKVSIKTSGGQVTSFWLHAGSTPQTNPAQAPFYRAGCAIRKGTISQW